MSPPRPAVEGCPNAPLKNPLTEDSEFAGAVEGGLSSSEVSHQLNHPESLLNEAGFELPDPLVAAGGSLQPDPNEGELGGSELSYSPHSQNQSDGYSSTGSNSVSPHNHSFVSRDISSGSQGDDPFTMLKAKGEVTGVDNDVGAGSARIGGGIANGMAGDFTGGGFLDSSLRGGIFSMGQQEDDTMSMCSDSSTSSVVSAVGSGGRVLTGGKWTKAEDAALRKAVEIHGPRFVSLQVSISSH